MKTKKEVLINFYEQTDKKLEQEKKKYKLFKEVLDTFEIIQTHSREMIRELNTGERK